MHDYLAITTKITRGYWQSRLGNIRGHGNRINRGNRDYNSAVILTKQTKKCIKRIKKSLILIHLPIRYGLWINYSDFEILFMHFLVFLVIS